MYRSKKIGVVVPAFNEERFIDATLKGIPEWVDLIIVVDDASQDETALRVRERSLSDSRLRLISMTRQTGPGAAIVKGYQAIHDNGVCDIAVVMAGDNQMAPGDLPGLLDPICDGHVNYVKGNRFRHAELHSVMPITRYLGNRVLTWVTRHISGYPQIEDAQCGYTALSADLLPPILRNGLVNGYGLPNAILLLLGRLGERVEQVPVCPIYRDEESGLNLFTVLRVYPFLFWQKWRENRRAPAREPSITDFKHDDPIGTSPVNR